MRVVPLLTHGGREVTEPVARPRYSARSNVANCSPLPAPPNTHAVAAQIWSLHHLKLRRLAAPLYCLLQVGHQSECADAQGHDAPMPRNGSVYWCHQELEEDVPRDGTESDKEEYHAILDQRIHDPGMERVLNIGTIFMDYQNKKRNLENEEAAVNCWL